MVLDSEIHAFLFYKHFADVKISDMRKRSTYFTDVFQASGGLTYCSNIKRLFLCLQYPYKPSEWRLFIDSSKSALKAVLLHIGNVQPSVPIAYSNTLKESRESMKLILDHIKYEDHKWLICSDLKVVGFLMGLQGGNVGYPCFLCLWHKGSKELHYTDKIWDKRAEVPEINKNNVLFMPLVDPKLILFPSLHLMIGYMTQHTTAIVKGIKNGDKGNEHAMEYLRSMMKHKTSAKIDGGIFDGPEIRKILTDNTFETHLTAPFQRALQAFRAVVEGFLGNHRAENYKELCTNMIARYGEIKAIMSVKMHFIHNHLNEFVENLGDYSDQHGE